ncbi:MAG: diaminopropionate ammonia-lyase, partial [Bacteroidales bacterium]|nr:diaminopropionate ammonia-lyase [Bacteroidales bacterium]
MKQELQWVMNRMPKTEDKNLPLMSVEEVQKARRFHESFPQYSVTPLATLPKMAEHLGLGRVSVKDESWRFGLNAFKVLGGSYAMARYIAEETGKDISELPYSVLTSAKLKEEFGTATFFSATDGNHGRGVAWAANKLGQKAVIIMPKGSTETRLNNIKAENADAWISDVNYDECVRQAAKLASETEHGVVVQDTAWEGYEKIPAWIMEGYGTMALEADVQFEERPTHVFVQAGVGSLAGAMVGYFANRYKGNPPVMVVVEAAAAACLYKG